MALRKPRVDKGEYTKEGYKVVNNRVYKPATEKQLISIKENFFIFRLKGLVPIIHQLSLEFKANDDSLNLSRYHLREALYHIREALTYFKFYQSNRIEKDKKNENISKLS